MITERAPAKVNLLLQVAGPRADGLHPLCSVFSPVRLEDELLIEPVEGARDTVHCAGVEGENLALAALAAYRSAAPHAGLPTLRITIEKRIPVAAGLGGGSADAAAVLRAATALAERPLGPDRLHALAAELGSDVPSQIEPRSALVQGVGERLEPLALAPMALVLVPSAEGLSTPRVYRELDRLRAEGLAPERAELDPEAALRLAGAPASELAAAMENDLEGAALSLRPELQGTLAALMELGALGARVTGSGPTAFGVFADRAAAEDAASHLPRAIVTATR